MAQQKKGFIARMIEGPERSETYARSTLPGNRWELGWDVFRNNLGKLFGLNLLMLLFFLPVIAVFVLRYIYVEYNALIMPFSQNVAVGYPAIPMTPGLTEQVYVMANRNSILFLPLAGIFASVGLSGGMYVMRNMIWGEGVMVGRDFWTGVKKNFGIVFVATLVYSIIITMCIFSASVVKYINATGNGAWWITLSSILSYAFGIFFTIIYLYALTLGVTYELKFKALMRNSFIMSIGLLPTNLFFAAFALISVILMFMGSLLFTLGLMLFVLFGLSAAALIWTDYSHWTFDKFINDKVPGAVKNRGIYSKTGDEEEKDFTYERSTLGKRPVKPITDYDVEIVEIPTNFSRADLKRLAESKAAMRKDSDDYVAGVLSGAIVENKNANTFEDLMEEQPSEEVNGSEKQIDSSNDVNDAEGEDN
ncbi:MAG: hypothetical protein IJW13_03090 [Clostridia bacterium]|nr:hypothetical protein [Clostridia bacterium]